MKNRFGDALSVELIPGSGGVYEITLDGRLIFSKKASGRFPEPGEVEKLIAEAS